MLLEREKLCVVWWWLVTSCKSYILREQEREEMFGEKVESLFFKTMKHLCGREKNVYRSLQFLATH